MASGLPGVSVFATQHSPVLAPMSFAFYKAI
jgi:hypothetical protein